MKNKVVSKILAIIGVISITLSVFAITVSADGGQIGNGVINDFDDSVDLYTKPPSDHGIPFETIYYGMAYRQIADTFGFSNNYTLDNVGVTYAPNEIGSSAYAGDQYRRVELIPSMYEEYPYPDAERGTVVAYYGTIDAGTLPNIWYDDPISYRYDSFLVGNVVNQAYFSESSLPSEAFPYAIDYVQGTLGRDLIYSNSYVASSVEHRISNTQLASSLIKSTNEDEDYLYFPTYIANYCLVPLDAVGIDYYYKFFVKGYSIDENGTIVNKETTINSSEDTNRYYTQFFYDTTLEPANYSDTGISITDMIIFYDEAYGLTTKRLYLYTGDLMSRIVEDYGIDVVTDISFRFGYEMITDNPVIVDYYDVVGSYPIIGSSHYYYNVVPYTMDKHISSVMQYDRYGYGGISQANEFSLAWLGDTIGGVLDVDLFGTFGLGDILYCVIGIGIFIAFLKIFAGG